MRTLCRALTIIANNAKIKDQRKIFSLGFLISFSSNLDTDEQEILLLIIQKHFGKTIDLKSFVPAELNNFMLV